MDKTLEEKLARYLELKREVDEKCAEMAAYGDALIAFWDGKSKGTLHMITEAERRNLLTQVIGY